MVVKRLKFRPKSILNVLSNTDIAELLAQEAESESGILTRAFRRAAGAAFLWPKEVAEVVAQNRSLTELRAIGPFIERQIKRWLDKPPNKTTNLLPSARISFRSLKQDSC